MGLNPRVTADEVLGVAQEGIRKFAPGTPLYVRPMIWARNAYFGISKDPPTR